MFLPEQIRSCMIENDVSSYLQTTSSGQVELWFFTSFKTSKKKKSEISLNHENFYWFSLWLTVKHREISNVKHQLQEKVFFNHEMLPDDIFMNYNSKSCVITEKEKFNYAVLCCMCFMRSFVANCNILSRANLFWTAERFKSHTQMNADWPINGYKEKCI